MCPFSNFGLGYIFTLSIDVFRQVVEVNELHMAKIRIEYKTEYFTAGLPMILFTSQRDLDQKIKTVETF